MLIRVKVYKLTWFKYLNLSDMQVKWVSKLVFPMITPEKSTLVFIDITSYQRIIIVMDYKFQLSGNLSL
jgi:hypothetical protein